MFWMQLCQEEAAYLATSGTMPSKHKAQHKELHKVPNILTFTLLFQDKVEVLERQLQKSNGEVEKLVNESPLYFTRTRGLFRECFLGEKSDDADKTNAPLGDLVELYMSPVETWCRNVDYYIPDENDETKTFNQEEMTRIRKSQLYVFLQLYFENPSLQI